MAIRYARPAERLTEPRVGGGTVGFMTLGERLRAVIDGKILSHAWVAEEAGITPAALSDILTGKTREPGFFTVLAICRSIEEPLSAIVDDPLLFWSADELERIHEFGAWAVERTTRKGAGSPLPIPSRPKKQRTARIQPVAATSGGVLYPDVSELPRKHIPARFAKLHADAVFSVTGESMIGEDILPDDLLYVRRTPQTKDAIGQIVVCSVDEMLLVKRLRTRGRNLLLESANDEHAPMLIDETSSRFRLIGIVVGKSRT